MKKLGILVIIVALLASSCGNEGNGELVGVPDRPDWFESQPFGMAFIPMGSYNMGPNDQDVPFAMTSQTKTVSIDPFWMDETEITNNEYRQFVFWVRDSLARRILSWNGTEGFTLPVEEDPENPGFADTLLNWEEPVRWGGKEEDGEEQMKILEKAQLFLTKEERYYNKREVDARKLNYQYWWIDLKQAAKRTNRYDFKTKKYTGRVIPAGSKNDTVITNRKSFIMTGNVNIYPDTLVWMADYTYSFNEPWTRMYFWHPAYDNYPVVGVSWVQATAFCIWRTHLMNNFLYSQGEDVVQDFRLPTESEWEYAARGGLSLSMYPWGGPYTRNNQGCFIANFKPLRGNYVDDGGIRTVEVQSYFPNEYGLFDMAGNVAEWTSNAFNESAYSFTHDLNPDYTYNATNDDPPVLKRKVVRGGSWKDIGYYLQCGTRTYEYQDTAKSYIGFRCVRSYMGRDQGDWENSQAD